MNALFIKLELLAFGSARAKGIRFIELELVFGKRDSSIPLWL